MVLSASLFNSTQNPLAFTPLVINKQTKSEKVIRGRWKKKKKKRRCKLKKKGVLNTYDKNISQPQKGLGNSKRKQHKKRKQFKD